MQEAFTDSKVKPSSMAGSVIALVWGIYFYQVLVLGLLSLRRY